MTKPFLPECNSTILLNKINLLDAPIQLKVDPRLAADEQPQVVHTVVAPISGHLSEGAILVGEQYGFWK